MLKKELIIGVLAISVLLGSFGSALAEDSNDKSILGTDEFSFKSSEKTTDVAARNYVYNHEQLDLIGAEAGGEITSTPQAPNASRSYDYNKEQLAVVGIAAGNRQWHFDYFYHPWFMWYYPSHS